MPPNPVNWEAGEQPIPQGLVARIASGLKTMFGKSPYAQPPVQAPIPFLSTVYGTVNIQLTTMPAVDWFGPGMPFVPVAPPETAGRQFDFPSYSNIDIRQKPREGVDYATLISLANSYDLVGMLIDTRKDQICKLAWSIGYKGDSKTSDASCDKIKDFLQSPDKEHSWQEWLRAILDDMLICDAATVFPRQTRGGELYALEYMDGSSIIRVIDNWGRTPLAPDPAYQQVLKGLPAVNMTRDQLIFKPRNVTTRRLFGLSPVERIVITVQIALRKQLYQLQYYTDGSAPDTLISIPGTAKQIAEFETVWNGLLSGNTADRRKTKFLPLEAKFYDTKQSALTDLKEQWEWLARVCCYCFGQSVQPFVSQMNRATAETADQQAKEEGIGPHMAWVKGFVDYILAHPACFNRPDLEFNFEDAEELDPKVKAEIQDTRLKNGSMNIDEVRDDNGEDPLPNGLGSRYLIYTGTGATPIEDVLDPPEPPPQLAVAAPGALPPNDKEQPPEPATKLAKAMLAHQRALGALLRKGMPVNREFDIPYGFGISKDGGTIYADKDMPEVMDVDGVPVDLNETCSTHEITEFSHCKDGDPYLQGHQKADEAEHALVARQGADPARYETLLEPFCDYAYAKAKAGKARTPPDLANYPYIESGEEHLLVSAEAEKLAKRKKKVRERLSLQAAR